MIHQNEWQKLATDEKVERLRTSQAGQELLIRSLMSIVKRELGIDLNEILRRVAAEGEAERQRGGHDHE
jgi:hypothetical protein